MLWLTTSLMLVMAAAFLGAWVLARRRNNIQEVIESVHAPGLVAPTVASPGQSQTGIPRKWLIATALGLLGLVSATTASLWLFGTGKPFAPEPSLVHVALGARSHPEVDESGFSYPEEHAGQPFRWTDGHGRLSIPIRRGESPEALRVRLKSFRHAGVGTADLGIRVNEKELFSGKIPLGAFENTLDLKGVDLGRTLVVDILSDTFCPLGAIRDNREPSDDGRTLGVQVWEVQLLERMPEALPK